MAAHLQAVDPLTLQAGLLGSNPESLLKLQKGLVPSPYGPWFALRRGSCAIVLASFLTQSG